VVVEAVLDSILLALVDLVVEEMEIRMSKVLKVL
jgi:hypothetical protein